MTDTLTPTQAAGRRQFLLLTALFVAPIVAAVTLYLHPEWQPKGRTHHGVLVEPARPLPALKLLDADGKAAADDALLGKWSIVQIGAADCAQPCADKLLQTRQIRTLLNEKRLRVQRVYIAPDAAARDALRTQLGSAHPDLRVFADDGATGARARDFFTLQGPQDAQAIYLLDPLGNWLMVYPEKSDYKNILKDLKYLLKLSQIG